MGFTAGTEEEKVPEPKGSHGAGAPGESHHGRFLRGNQKKVVKLSSPCKVSNHRALSLAHSGDI